MRKRERERELVKVREEGNWTEKYIDRPRRMNKAKRERKKEKEK